MKNNRLLPIFLVVFIDLLGFSLILPLLPYYAQTFGSNPTVTGLLVGSYALAQLVGAPLLGRLSDRWGRRPILLISIGGTFVGFLMLAFANSLWMLFASRLLDGLTGGNLSVAQAYISDVTDEKSRAKGLGMIGAAFGLGFILGPAIGGALSVYGYAAPAFAAAALSFLNWIAVLIGLPESLTPARRAALANRPQPAITPRALVAALRRPRVGPLLHIRFFFGLAFATFQTIFALYAQYRLGLSVQQTSFVLVYVGVLSVLVQGFAIGKLTTRFKETQLIFSSAILMGLALLGWAVAPNLWVLLVIMAPLSFAGGVLNTVLSSTLTKAVYPEQIGGTLGLAAAIESLTRVIAPSLGGFLLERAGTWAPGLVSALIMAWVVTFIYRRLVANPDPPLPSRGPGGREFAYQPVHEQA